MSLLVKIIGGGIFISELWVHLCAVQWPVSQQSTSYHEVMSLQNPLGPVSEFLSETRGFLKYGLKSN